MIVSRKRGAPTKAQRNVKSLPNGTYITLLGGILKVGPAGISATATSPQPSPQPSSSAVAEPEKQEDGEPDELAGG